MRHGVAEGTSLHVGCSLVSGVVACLVTAPADMIKTRVMGDAGSYRGATHCLARTVREEGVLALWRGALPSYLRLGPHFLMTFPLYERIRAMLGLGYL